MNDSKKTDSKKQRLLKILIPVLMVLVLAGIWAAKNAQIFGPSLSSDAGSAISDNNPDFVLDLTGTIDMKKMQSYGLPIIIDFGADYCAPCRELAPILKKLNRDLRGKAIIRYADVEKYPKLVEGYPIRVIPTQVLYDADGKPYIAKGSNAAAFKTYYSADNKALYTLHEGGMTEAAFQALLTEMGMKK
jgi:thioredoxin 1